MFNFDVVEQNKNEDLSHFHKRIEKRIYYMQSEITKAKLMVENEK